MSLRSLVSVAVLCTTVAAPARAEEIAESRTLLWLSVLAAPPVVSPGESASAGERVTLDDAIALALDANRLAKKPERRQLVRQDVVQAYDAVRRAQRVLEIREESLTMCRELDHLMVQKANRGKAAPSVVLQARAARERATSDVLSARQELAASIRQLNHLMGRDPQARLLLTSEPGPPPADPIRLGVATVAHPMMPWGARR